MKPNICFSATCFWSPEISCKIFFFFIDFLLTYFFLLNLSHRHILIWPSYTNLNVHKRQKIFLQEFTVLKIYRLIQKKSRLACFNCVVKFFLDLSALHRKKAYLNLLTCQLILKKMLNLTYFNKKLILRSSFLRQLLSFSYLRAFSRNDLRTSSKLKSFQAESLMVPLVWCHSSATQCRASSSCARWMFAFA